MAGCRDSDPTVAAVVADTPITTAALSDAYARLVLRAGLPGGDAAVRDRVLESLIHRQLVIQEAWDGGIRETPEYREEEARVRRKLLIDYYVERVVFDTLRVTDEELRDLFLRANTVYEARHLRAGSLAEAQALRRRLLAGETFEALAREVFADPTLARNGGFLGEFGHDEMDPAFEMAAFTTPVGQISEPVRTAQGWSVLRVESRATRPLLTETEFQTRRDPLLRYERRRQRTEARFQFSRRVRDEVAPRFHEAALDRLAALAAGGTLAADAAETWYRTPLVTFTSQQGGRRTWTVADVEAQAQLAGDEARAAVQDEASLREFIEGLVVREELVARAKARGYERAPRYEQTLAEALAEWVFDQAQRLLRERFAPSEDTLRAHFAAHRDNYLTPERVRVHEILVATRAEAAALKAQVEAGADFSSRSSAFAALARARSLRPGSAAAGGDLGYVDRAALGMLAEPVFAARPGAVVGPLEVAGRYVVLLRGNTQDPRPMTFAEARDQVAEDLDLTYAQARLAEHVGRLRSRYRVEVRPEAVRRVRLIS
ncbi:MAG TPA: peptidylprolyl isomerase [Rubricoccaceae bacterium]|nr:peptidylprolyl isomerase [Rubricoccaceae bacterium]